MSHADYLDLGTWNAICDACGRKFKAHQLTRRWDGLMVCSRDWEPRHSQDFARARPTAEPTPLPWTRDVPTPIFIQLCTPDGRTSIPNLAIPGCMLPGFVDPANTEGI